MIVADWPREPVVRPMMPAEGEAPSSGTSTPSFQYHPLVLERNDQLVRDLEANLLDRHHLRFALFRRGQQTAVSHVLKILGDLLREYETASMDRTWTTRQVIAQVTIEAAEHAIRWILDLCPIGTNRPGVDWKRKDEEAVELLAWAVQYARLYADHTAWSRGMMIPLVDTEAKIVEFQPPAGGLRVFLGQLESEQARAEACHSSMPPDIDEELLTPWVRGFAKRDVYSLPTLSLTEESAVYQNTTRWATATILPEIEANRDLGGFSLGDFRQFYVRLWLNCQCITRLEGHFDQALGHEHIFGSRLLQGRQDYIAYWISQYCRLPAKVASAILEQLTFRRDHRHPSLPGHPFVRTADGAVTMLARMFARTDPNLMLSMAMNAGAGKKIYESIIEEIETATKRQLAQYLREHGYVVWDDPSLKRPGSDPLTPDLVVSRAADEWIAVVEYKHALPPRGAAGVSDRIKEASRWINKAQRYRDAADQQAADVEVRLGIPSAQRRVFVALVARWPMPVQLEMNTDRMVLTDLSRVKLAAKGGCEVRRLFGESEAGLDPSIGHVFHKITVQDWTYRHPIVAVVENADG